MKQTNRRFLVAAILLLIVCLVVCSCSFGKKCKHKDTALIGQKDATCAETGYTGDTVCNKCEKVVKKGTEIAMLAHTYGEGKVTKTPTCIETGLTTYTCSGCGIFKQTAIETVSHQDIYHDAQDGSHNHTCTTCTMLKNETHIPADEGVKHEASCTEPAYTEYTCTACEGVYKVYDPNSHALDHEMSAWQTSKNSTCCETGIKAQYCAREGCDFTNEITIPMSEGAHIYELSYYDSEPSCVDDGTAVYVCRDCGEEEQRNAPATGIHSYQTLESNGDGWTRQECSHCQNLISSFDASDMTSATLSAGNINTDTDLEMSMQGVAMQFPQNVVSQISSGNDVSFGADKLTDADKNAAVGGVSNAEIKEALSDAPIYDFGVSIDGQSFTANFSEKVLVTMPYDNGDKDAEGIVIYYLAANGTVEEITDAVYDAETRQITFFVNHFSFYAVAYRETQEMRCKRGNHDYRKTSQTVTATCYTFGYTVYECSCCHAKTIDDIVEKEPHEYGDLIAAAPTCEYGDYSTRKCQNEGCGYILNVQFFGATGHKIDAPASCTTPATCTKCKNVVMRALGHGWTEWETVVEATEEKSGLRRRYCLTCGEMAEGKIAALGAVKPLDFDSYSELADVLLKDILKMSGGKITYEVARGEFTQTQTVELMEKDGKYIALIETVIKDNEGHSQTQKAYYDDGAIVILRSSTDSDGEDYSNISAMDMDAFSMYPFAVFEAALKDLHATLDEYVAEYLEQARSFLDGQGPAMTEKLNELLANAGIDYTVSSLSDLLDSIETFYAYLSLRLGYQPTAELKDEVAVPTKDDVHAVLSAFMTATEKNGVTTYSCDAAPLLDVVGTLVEWLDERIENTLDAVLYEVLGDKLVATDPTLKSFDACFERLAEEFPGTMKVAHAIDKFISVFEDNGLLTLDSLYSIIDLAASRYMGSDFSTEELISVYANQTLNDLAVLYFNSTEARVEDLYAFVKEYCKNTKLGDVSTESDFGSVGQILMMAKNYLEYATIEGNLAFSIDAEGRLIAFECNELVALPMEGPDADPTVLQSMKASFEHDANYKVTLPEEFKGFVNHVSQSYDKDGNLVIEGLDSKIDYEITLDGDMSMDIASLLTLDKELSDVLGFKVYKTDKKYWTDSYSSDRLYSVNGKYYRDYSYVSGLGTNGNAQSVLKTLNANALLCDPSALLPLAGAACDGYAGENTYDGTIPAWNFIFGIVYQNENGEWMICRDYGTKTSEGKTSYSLWGEGESFERFFEGIRLSSLDATSNTARYNGKEYPLHELYFQTDNSYRTYEVRGIFVNDEFLLVEVDNTGGEQARVFYDEVEFPDASEYDDYEEYTIESIIIDENGNAVRASYKCYEFITYIPTYYVKIADGKFASIGELDYDKDGVARYDGDFLRTGFFTAGFESVKLPDGNTLYVLGTDTDNDAYYENGYTTVYGYAQTVDGIFIQTICYQKDGKIVEVIYRNAGDRISVNPQKLFDVDSYLTEKDGKYTISASLISELKKLCTEQNDCFGFNVTGEKTVGEQTCQMSYTFGYEVNDPAYSFPDIFGMGSDWKEGVDWYGYFSSNEPGEYELMLDEKGNLILYYKDGSLITDLDFDFNNAFPADSILELNEELSRQTGLNIYSYYTRGSYSSSLGSYVYENDKYYEYELESTYELEFIDSASFLSNWSIDSMHYRFDIYPADGIDAVPVYETEISFGRSFDNAYRMTLYTFFMDGKLCVAKQAYTTGNSLLTFESYQPFSEYITSLEMVFAPRYEGGQQRYHLNTKKTFYRDTVYIYETDGHGNRLYIEGSENQPKASFGVDYLNQNGKATIVCDSGHIGYCIEVGAQISDPSVKFNAPNGYDKELSTENYYNKTVTIVRYTTVYESTTSYDFIKLAGKYYDYNHISTYCYLDRRLTAEDFALVGLDKVWYYKVVDSDTGEVTYYTEFIPSDFGFAPAGEEVNESAIGGSFQSETLLGYTAEGHALYEVAFFAESSANKSYTTVTQSDGTVFYHVDGKGYLKDQKGYYIPARQVTNADGQTEIVCLIRSAFVYDDYLNDHNELLDKYLSIGNGGATLIITPEMLEFAKHNRNDFEFTYEYKRGWNTRSEEIGYDRLEALFMSAEQQ